MPAELAAADVRVGITGAIYSRRFTPDGIDDITNATDPVPSDFVGHGYANEDGLTENHDDSVDTVVAWQGAVVVRSIRTESVMTMEFTLLQTRGSVLELFHPGSHVEANGDGEYVMHVKPPTAERREFVFDMVDGDTLTRYYIGAGELTERGEVPHSNGDPTQYPMTITCYPDANGDLCRKYSNSSAWGLGIDGGGS